MIWESWAAFIQMGKHGNYVWMAFGITALCIFIEILCLRHHKKTIHQQTAMQTHMATKDQ